MDITRRAACVLAFATAAAFPAAAQTSSPIRLVVGYPPGGSSDAVARMVGEKLSAELGALVIVDNRAGAGGQIAADYVRQQPADGHTLLVANTQMMVMIPLTYKSVRYDSVKDFAPVGRMTSFYEAIAVPSSSQVSTVAQWLEQVRKEPRRGTFGVPAAGSVSHFLGFRIGTDAHVPLLPVPYKGAAPVVQDLLGGQVDAGIVPVLDVAPHSAAGKVRVLAVNGPVRAQLLPNVPTLKELGIAGFESLEWTGILAPAGTPKATVDRINAALNKALAAADVKQRLLDLGMEVAPGTPEALGRSISTDLAHWRPVVKASGFTAD